MKATSKWRLQWWVTMGLLTFLNRGYTPRRCTLMLDGGMNGALVVCVFKATFARLAEALESIVTEQKYLKARDARHRYTQSHVSAVGDPGMQRDGLRVAFEAWNFCNEVGQEAPQMGSPRAADCFDLSDTPSPWQFWMVMLKNGNYDTRSGLCPQDGKKVPPFSPGRFPCFGQGCMNQPLLCHQQTQLKDGIMIGGFGGTYDLDSDCVSEHDDGLSYYEVVWEKKVNVGSWVFKHKLKTSKKYPWLMLYLRADATRGFSGGYHYDTRGMLKSPPESPNFKVKLSLDIKKGGGSKSQFYLVDIGSCWKNNGAPCDGDVLTDVTRYSEMIINPETPAWCSPTGLVNCPPFHITPDNKKIYRNDTANFPYLAYHYYCAPGNAQHLEQPVSTCDPYSNPQAQEIVQLLPHPIWAEYGYPTKKGDGWVGDARTWELDVGGLSSRLYFYQDPGTPPAKRVWASIDTGTEIFVSNKDEVAEWTLSDFDVILTQPKTKLRKQVY
ncbi:hypothetical protein SESBI_10949 [Sesbania bispinosa]|nr:hypothetical protein SESBI_10949 [Sesbania bispinosa]